MIADQFLQLSNNQAPVDSAGTTTYPAVNNAYAYSANYIDLLQIRDIGDGSDLEVQLFCTEAMSANTITSVLVVAGTSPYANGNGQTITIGSFGMIGGISGGANVLRRLAVGDRLVTSLSPTTFSLGFRYLYVIFCNHSTSVVSTTGKFTIDVCSTTQTTSSNLSYPGGFTVS